MFSVNLPLGGSMDFIEIVGLVLIPFVFHELVFWGYSLYIHYRFDYPLYDVNQKAPEFKRQPKVRVTPEEVRHCVKSLLLNQVFVLIPFALVQAPFLRWSSPQLAEFGRNPFAWHGIPNIFHALLQLLGSYVFVEAGFYYSHRLLVSFFFEMLNNAAHKLYVQTIPQTTS
jgi:hypothetical protein